MTVIYFTAISTLPCPITVGKWREQKLFWTDRQRDCVHLHQSYVASCKLDSINYLWG